MGLTGMGERARAIDGELRLESARGAGTRVRLRVALSVLAGEDAKGRPGTW